MKELFSPQTRSFDLPLIYETYLQEKMDLTAPPSTTENSVLSESLAADTEEQLDNCNEAPKMVLKGPHSKSQTGKQLKLLNTSQSLFSDAVPLRSQLSRQAKKTRFDDNSVGSVRPIPAKPDHEPSTRNRKGKFKLNVADPDLLIPIISEQIRVKERHSNDLNEPLLSTSNSKAASLQPESPETTTSKSSSSLASSLLTGSSRTSDSSSKGISGTTATIRCSLRLVFQVCLFVDIYLFSHRLICQLLSKFHLFKVNAPGTLLARLLRNCPTSSKVWSTLQLCTFDI